MPGPRAHPLHEGADAFLHPAGDFWGLRPPKRVARREPSIRDPVRARLRYRLSDRLAEKGCHARATRTARVVRACAVVSSQLSATDSIMCSPSPKRWGSAATPLPSSVIEIRRYRSA